MRTCCGNRVKDQFGRNYAILGQSGEQRARVTEACRIFTNLAKRHPQDAKAQYADAIAQYELGKVEHTQGQFNKAVELFQAAETKMKALGATKNIQVQTDLANLQMLVGDALKERGSYDEALAAYRISLKSIIEHLASTDSQNMDWQYGLAILHIKIGDMYQVRLDLNNALASVGSRSQIEYKPLPDDDPKHRQPDIALAKRLLNWEPTIALEYGLARTVAYFREQLGAQA
jgi:tetratricopeptide (TPR) repeat protein